jgi:antitoxin HicB
MNRYTVILTPEPDGSAYNVSVPALPGCFTWGATVEEALAMAKDAIAVYLADEDPAETAAMESKETIVATVTV